MTFELLAFTAISVVVVAVLAGVIFLVGFSFNLNFGAAIAIATYTFVVLLPGGMNLWIAAFATGLSDEEGIAARALVERITAYRSD